MANENDKLLFDVVRQFGIDILIQISESFAQKNAIASAKLLNSLTYNLTESLPIIGLDIICQDYIRTIEDGRKANSKQPPLSKIKTWCKFKSIDLKYAYPIARKIGKFGIAPRPVIQPILNNLGLTFNKEAADKFRFYIETRINEIIEDTNKQAA